MGTFPFGSHGRSKENHATRPSHWTDMQAPNCSFITATSCMRCTKISSPRATGAKHSKRDTTPMKSPVASGYSKQKRPKTPRKHPPHRNTPQINPQPKSRTNDRTRTTYQQTISDAASARCCVVGHICRAGAERPQNRRTEKGGRRLGAQNRRRRASADETPHGQKKQPRRPYAVCPVKSNRAANCSTKPRSKAKRCAEN